MTTTSIPQVSIDGAPASQAFTAHILEQEAKRQAAGDKARRDEAIDRANAARKAQMVQVGEAYGERAG